MILYWDGDILIADKHALAEVYKVSLRSVERHCTPLRYNPREGAVRGEAGAALYDALAAAEVLATIQPRAARTAQGLRAQMQRHYLT